LKASWGTFSPIVSLLASQVHLTKHRRAPAPSAEMEVHLFAITEVSARHLYDPALLALLPGLPS